MKSSGGLKRLVCSAMGKIEPKLISFSLRETGEKLSERTRIWPLTDSDMVMHRGGGTTNILDKMGYLNV